MKIWQPKKQPCHKNGYLQTAYDKRAARKRLWVPKLLRFAPGYPCCCGSPAIEDDCPCGGDTLSSVMKITIAGSNFVDGTYYLDYDSYYEDPGNYKYCYWKLSPTGKSCTCSGANIFETLYYSLQWFYPTSYYTTVYFDKNGTTCADYAWEHSACLTDGYLSTLSNYPNDANCNETGTPTCHVVEA